MFEITYGKPTGFETDKFENAAGVLSALAEVDTKEYDIYIDHQVVDEVDLVNIENKNIKEDTNIIVQSKMIGA